MKKYLALKASAGSGKTFALTVRYISLLLLGSKPSEILTLTFTNKAANEMSERIYKTLLTLGDDEAYLSAICEASSLRKEEVLGAKKRLIDSFSNANLSIYTIDKFVNSILKQFCGYIGISDDFEIKEDDVEKLSYKFLQSLDSKTFDTLIEFSLYEKKKFNSIFELFKNLLEKNEKIEAINIDGKLIPLQKEQVLKEAFKIKEFILNCDVASASAKKAVDFENFDDLLSKTWHSKNSASEYSYFKKCANDTLESFFSSLKEQIHIYYKLRAGYSLSRLFELFLNFKGFKEEFNKAKNYLEFNDVSNLVYDLLNEKIDKEFLYFRLDSSYSHILIDEFQDTSLLQYKILKPLIDEILSGDESKFKSFFYVGDTKQSIYRFRGGKRELFDYVANSNSLVEVEVLNTNYRSKEQIISYVNSLFNRLPNYEYYDQLTISKGGYVEVLEDEAFEEDEKFKNVASKIAWLLKNGVNSNDIAILTYTNDDVLSLYNYLKVKFPKLKISTEMTSKLINQQNVKAIINAIKYLYFKEDIYRENLNALIGKELLNEFTFTIDTYKTSIPSLIKAVANHLQIMDENIIKFVEVSDIYLNIVDFVYEIDRLDVAMDSSESSGLQILTIFKSKGLEFHTVLLLDRINKKNVDRSTLLFEYDSVDLKNIYYKIKGYESFDKEYRDAIRKEKALSVEDEINILYVAMTRAKNNMIIFKKQKSSVFDILDAQPLSVGSIVESSNISINYEKDEKVSYTPLNLGVQEKPIQEDKDSDDEVLYARYFGIAAHYCLEMMDEFSLESLDYCIKLTKSRYLNYLNEEDFEQIKNRIKLMIEDKKFASLIKDSTFIAEQSLIYKEELKIIDLLFYKDDTYYIVDYKTTLSQSPSHIEQVSFYKKAISEIFETSKVEAYLAYLGKDEFILKSTE